MKDNGLDDLSKNELIDTALLGAVSGGGCDRWAESCGCDSLPGVGECCDWCGRWVRTTVEPEPFEEL
jgi:hypothetical protein